MSEITLTNIYIVWTNTDLTEGRGQQVPVAYCASRSTAIRIAKRKGVQGTDAEVMTFPAIKHNGLWCAPFQMIQATDEDKKAEAAAEKKLAVIEKALASGLTKADLAELGVKA